MQARCKGTKSKEHAPLAPQPQNPSPHCHMCLCKCHLHFKKEHFYFFIFLKLCRVQSRDSHVHIVNLCWKLGKPSHNKREKTLQKHFFCRIRACLSDSNDTVRRTEHHMLSASPVGSECSLPDMTLA